MKKILTFISTLTLSTLVFSAHALYVGSEVFTLESDKSFSLVLILIILIEQTFIKFMSIK